ncbi:sensor histidine kinase [Flavitalea sp.]|nr:histidine kinase [Flavitalea sp.]
MQIYAKTGHWFFRYKLYHLPFWFLYHCAWWTINIGNPLAVANNILYSPYAIKFFFYVIFQALGVYFNLYFLIPRFLEKAKYLEYIVYLSLTIIATAAFIASGYNVSGWLSGKTMLSLYGVEPANYLYFFQMNTLPSTVASMTLAMCVKLTKNWLQGKQRERELQQEKLETELKFLKSQFNPHFLFNTINSIFVLIHKNPDKASESLAKFSELLRYQLYECNEQQIPLKQEISYLVNFIELERLRQERNLELTVNIDQQVNNDLVIAPFMLIPFVENAFKHVNKLNGEISRISIELKTKDADLYMTVTNSVANGPAVNADVIHFSGIGLTNIQRRLELLYPDAHVLSARRGKGEYKVELSVLLHQHQPVNLKMVPL